MNLCDILRIVNILVNYLSHISLGITWPYLLPEYDVDCEYNRNKDDKNYGKEPLDQILLFMNVEAMSIILLL